jgi:CelD/BcsL family acetyltransferase involved in cellulose biosynthesis
VDASVSIVRDAAAMAAIAAQWDELAAQAIEPNPFYESWSLLPALNACGDLSAFRCVLVWTGAAHGRQLAGLFPFELRRRFLGLPVGVLTSWRHDSWLLCTPLVRHGSAPECLRALLDWLDKGEESAAAAELRYLPAEGALSGRLADLLRATPSKMLVTDSFTRAFLRKRPQAGDQVEPALSRDSRKSLRRKERNLRKHGKLERVALRAGEDAGPWIREFLALEASGWKGRRGSALASTPANRAFATAMLAEAHRRNRLQLLGLDLDARPIARCCNLVGSHGDAYAYRTAYDQAFGRYSPGILAELDSIAAFDGLRETGWMDSVTEPGNSTLNRLWPDRRTIQSMLVGAGSWGELLVSIVPLARWTRRRVSGLAGRLPLPAKVKAH